MPDQNSWELVVLHNGGAYPVLRHETQRSKEKALVKPVGGVARFPARTAGKGEAGVGWVGDPRALLLKVRIQPLCLSVTFSAGRAARSPTHVCACRGSCRDSSPGLMAGWLSGGRAGRSLGFSGWCRVWIPWNRSASPASVRNRRTATN